MPAALATRIPLDLACAIGTFSWPTPKVQIISKLGIASISLSSRPFVPFVNTTRISLPRDAIWAAPFVRSLPKSWFGA